jgi:hypothetical protein
VVSISKKEAAMIWLFFIIFVAFVLDLVSKQGGIYWFDPGLPEYLFSLGYLFLVVALLLRPVVRLGGKR